MPGGGVEPGESFEQAAVREAREELGLEVELEAGAPLEVEFGGPQRYFRARVVGGELSERFLDEKQGAGTYRPVRVALAELAVLDVRPPELRSWLAPGTPRSRPPSR